MNVLVVDDEVAVRYELSEKLSQSGFSVTVASDGQSAVELFRCSAFDAVLLDLKMPGMDGIEALKEMRTHDPDTPVIILAASEDMATAVQAINAGAYDFAEKPPQADRIVLTLKRAVEKAGLEREVRDLGKSVKESDALKRAYEKLKELDQVKTTFLSMVSHELRTPLTSIIGFAEISRKKIAKLILWISGTHPNITKKIQEVDGNFKIIVTEARRLAGLIDGILDLIAMEAGTAEWKWEAFSLREVIENAAAALTPVFRKKGLEFALTIEDDLPLIKGDRYRIYQVINELLCNAAAFTNQGSVTLGAKRVDNEVILSVADTGIGILPSRHGLIFEKFSQIGDMLAEKPGGGGLGLPICKLIVGYHRGEIVVDSEPGKGSLFTIVLPIDGETGA